MKINVIIKKIKTFTVIKTEVTLINMRYIIFFCK